jgi:hypothetical protein
VQPFDGDQLGQRDLFARVVARKAPSGGPTTFAALFLAVSLNHLASAETYICPGRSCPAPQLETAGEMPLAVLCNRRPTMSAQIIKASVSLVAVATSAVSLFVISWVGLALLGF